MSAMDRVRLVKTIRIASDLGLAPAIRVADAILKAGWTLYPPVTPTENGEKR